MKIDWYKILGHSFGICAVLWLLCVILALNSCGVVTKNTVKSTTNTDSAATTQTNDARVIKADSTGSKIEEGEYERETIFSYDTVYLQGDTVFVPRLVYIKEKGRYKKEEAAATVFTDSSTKQQAATITLKKEEQASNTTRKSWSLPWWVKGLAIVIIAALAYRSYKQYFT